MKVLVVWNAAITAVLIAVTAIFVLHPARADRSAATDIVRTKRLEIIGADGRTDASLGVEDGGRQLLSSRFTVRKVAQLSC
jgi:hypothetical protein